MVCYVRQSKSAGRVKFVNVGANNRGLVHIKYWIRSGEFRTSSTSYGRQRGLERGLVTHWGRRQDLERRASRIALYYFPLPLLTDHDNKAFLALVTHARPHECSQTPHPRRSLTVYRDCDIVWPPTSSPSPTLAFAEQAPIEQAANAHTYESCAATGDVA